MKNSQCDAISFLVYTAFLLVTAVIIIFTCELAGRDVFGQIGLSGNRQWYVDYDDGISQELQDRDILYHEIGASISEARKADIVILGHSSVLWALRDDMLADFSSRTGIRIYNLATAGDPSGEFGRLIVERGQIHPRLFVINADDRTINFFTPTIKSAAMFHDSNAATVTTSTWLHAYIRVASRNVRWQTLDVLSRLMPSTLFNDIYRNKQRLRTWRHITTGGWNFSGIPFYWTASNPPLSIVRPPKCPASEEEIKNARDYISNIGSPAILMLIPTPEFCSERVREIADRLRLETIIPSDADYTVVDKVHFDFRGATRFTNFFIHSLENTEQFRRLVPHPKES